MDHPPIRPPRLQVEHKRAIVRIHWHAASNEVPPSGIGRPGIDSEHPFIAGSPARADHAIVIFPVRKRQQRHLAANQLRKLVA